MLPAIIHIVKKFILPGVGIYYRKKLEELRKMYSKVTEDMANASILADLQQKQDSEFDALLPGLHLKVNRNYNKIFSKLSCRCLPCFSSLHVLVFVINLPIKFHNALFKAEKDLENVKLQARQARKEEHCDCMAAVILGSFELSEDEMKYTEALEEKYDALRMVMLRHCLKLEVGLAWERFDKCLS